MFKPVRKKINEIDHSAAEALLQSNRRGILAMNGDNGYPYAIPINYFYDSLAQKIYFHGKFQIRYVLLYMVMSVLMKLNPGHHMCKV